MHIKESKEEERTSREVGKEQPREEFQVWAPSTTFNATESLMVRLSQLVTEFGHLIWLLEGKTGKDETCLKK